MAFQSSTLKHVTTSPVGASAPGKQLRAVVRWAVDTRLRMIQWNWSRHNLITAQQHVNRLQKWLSAHADASAESIRRFDVELGTSLRYVLPGNAAGKAKVQEYERILLSL